MENPSSPSLDLISLATPALPHFDEKAPIPRQPSRGRHLPREHSSPSSSRPHRSLHPPAQFIRHPPPPLNLQVHNRSFSSTSSYPRPSKVLRVARLLRPWVPLLLYALTSLAFVVAIALYRADVFARLDELSSWLRVDEQSGHAILFCLIFITTIPPIPLYSTLIILSGYTFGPWTGAIISYFAALSGALTVFIVSRSLFRESISHWLASCTSIKRVVRAIEKRPKLLFLIRLAPYPYNVMNCLLAASPTLSLHTYTVCTALSLFKVIIHTSVGASIHSFKDYHTTPSNGDQGGADMVARMWTIVGILLCVIILVYLSIVARRAVDDELDDGPVTTHDSEETRAFLAPQASSDLESAHPYPSRPMAELPSRSHQMIPYPSLEAETTNEHWS
ncbi:hypothetical protein K443DRAFT_672417 [Laccaria amethystina LaAM-08-1]|uniref:Golgi apparatus membrane protein TVP38 n=1 Tax=Laccaria amethystina LaAM-08-1 TaxID=1095629 RepID=A0A0C9X833_9AGAR|nr:hypothetical protein K443DRAFT_672417 [Laccaria amethystina LaAM-08-1]